VWVLEQTPTGQPGTAESCREVLDSFDSDNGWCVGDSETLPDAGTFDASPFSIGRGFDIILDRGTMEIVFSASHGTPTGNDNLDGDAILTAVQEAVANAR
jgi:hypothetical protein